MSCEVFSIDLVTGLGVRTYKNVISYHKIVGKNDCNKLCISLVLKLTLRSIALESSPFSKSPIG